MPMSHSYIFAPPVTAKWPPTHYGQNTAINSKGVLNSQDDWSVDVYTPDCSTMTFSSLYTDCNKYSSPKHAFTSSNSLRAPSRPCSSLSSSSSGSLDDKRILPAPPTNSVMFHEARYKTELCRQFQELGFCEYSDRCLFAHGNYELKQLSHRHPRFKTEKCSFYHNGAICLFGPRCNYVHGKTDANDLLEKLAKEAPKIPMPENPVRNLKVGKATPIAALIDKHAINFVYDQENFFKSVYPSNRLPVFKKICKKFSSIHSIGPHD